MIKDISISKLDDLVLEKDGFRNLVQANIDKVSSKQIGVAFDSPRRTRNQILWLLVKIKRVAANPNSNTNSNPEDWYWYRRENSKIRLDISLVEESNANGIQIFRYHYSAKGMSRPKSETSCFFQ